MVFVLCLSGFSSPYLKKWNLYKTLLLGVILIFKSFFKAQGQLYCRLVYPPLTSTNKSARLLHKIKSYACSILGSVLRLVLFLVNLFCVRITYPPPPAQRWWSFSILISAEALLCTSALWSKTQYMHYELQANAVFYYLWSHPQYWPDTYVKIQHKRPVKLASISWPKYHFIY